MATKPYRLTFPSSAGQPRTGVVSSTTSVGRLPAALRSSEENARHLANEYRSTMGDPVDDLAKLYDASPEEWKILLEDEFDI